MDRTDAVIRRNDRSIYPIGYRVTSRNRLDDIGQIATQTMRLGFNEQVFGPSM
jgi:hypothetical protein